MTRTREPGLSPLSWTGMCFWNQPAILHSCRHLSQPFQLVAWFFKTAVGLIRCRYPPHLQQAQHRVAVPTGLTVALEEGDTEYTYFTDKHLQHWAGPSHWRFQRKATGTTHLALLSLLSLSCILQQWPWPTFSPLAALYTASW